MKRKTIISLLALTCAATLTIGLAACGEGGNQGETPSGTPPPNYIPKDEGNTDLFTFELDEDEKGYTVTGLAEGVTNANVTVPAIYENLPVTTIGERAFGDCTQLTSVTLTSGIISIGSGAFTGCTGLLTFKFPASITLISDSAFQNCSGLKTLSFNGTSQLETIEASAFQNCSDLLNANLPDSVKTVGDRVFQGCSSLLSVTLGDGVESLGIEVFRGCSSLKNVTIGNSLKTAGERAFENCTLIEELRFPNSLERVGLGLLNGCTGLKTLSLPFIGSEKRDEPVPEDEENSNTNPTYFGYIFGAKSFDDQASLELNNLETLTITGNSPIGYHAFTGIGHIDSTETVTTGLSTIIITGDVEIIGAGAFQSCYNLQTLVLPKSVKKIGLQLVGGAKIKHVYYCGSETEWNNINDGGWSGNRELYGRDADGTQISPDPRYFYSETQPATDGNFWHYVEGKPTVW